MDGSAPRVPLRGSHAAAATAWRAARDDGRRRLAPRQGQGASVFAAAAAAATATATATATAAAAAAAAAAAESSSNNSNSSKCPQHTSNTRNTQQMLTRCNAMLLSMHDCLFSIIFLLLIVLILKHVIVIPEIVSKHINTTHKLNVICL